MGKEHLLNLKLNLKEKKKNKAHEKLKGILVFYTGVCF